MMEIKEFKPLYDLTAHDKDIASVDAFNNANIGINYSLSEEINNALKHTSFSVQILTVRK